MADHAVDDDFDGDIFIYRGGRAPQHITHVLIDESVDEIEEEAFKRYEHLLTVETHDGLRRVGKQAFERCRSLQQINLKSATGIEESAFYACENLESVEFGDRLETIGDYAFWRCALKHVKLPSIITIGLYAFSDSERLTDIELSERLESIGKRAFYRCERLQRIAIPLKRDLFVFDEIWKKYDQFDGCEQLSTVDIVGEAHTQTIASLHMESWRIEMNAEINRINQVFPTTAYGKTNVIRHWMESLLDKLDHYKAEHYRHVKEGISLLELALWKAKLGEKEGNSVEGRTKKAKVDATSARKERRITCGADIVIKNVLPFLQVE